MSIPSSKLTELTFESDVAGKSVIELAGLELYDDTGNAKYLTNTDSMLDRWLLIGKELRAISDYLLEQQTARVLNVGASYIYYYADVVATPTILTFASQSVSPRPVDILQTTVFKNGVYLNPNTDYTMNSTGITLDEALVTDDVVTVWVYSFETYTSRKVYAYRATSGTGTGNKVFTLSDLGSDLEDNAITDFPASSSRIKVWLNGLLYTNTVGYTMTGTGEDTVITFANDLDASFSDEARDEYTGDYVVFEIWSA